MIALLTRISFVPKICGNTTVTELPLHVELSGEEGGSDAIWNARVSGEGSVIVAAYLEEAKKSCVCAGRRLRV